MSDIVQGHFIVVEGIDGSGQDTQAELLEKYLMSQGFNVLKTREPTEEREIGVLIHKVLSGNLVSPGALALQKWMVIDRSNHLSKEIEPHLNDGGVVVCVRYFYSTLAYGQADGLDYDELWEMNCRFRRPDLVIYLDLEPQVSLVRIKERAEQTGKSLEIFEKQETLMKVRNNFLAMQRNFSEMVTINALGTPNEVHQRILQHIDLSEIKQKTRD